MVRFGSTAAIFDRPKFLPLYPSQQTLRDGCLLRLRRVEEADARAFDEYGIAVGPVRSAAKAVMGKRHRATTRQMVIQVEP